MRRLTYPAILFSLASLLLSTGALPRASGGPGQVVPIGTGARFLPPDTAFYLAADARSDQWEHVKLITQYYQSRSRSGAVGGAMDRATGLPVDRLLNSVLSWAGGEVFVAVPDASDAFDSRFSSFSAMSSNLPGIMAGAAIEDRIAFFRFVDEMHREFGAERLAAFAGSPGEIFEIGGNRSMPPLYVAIRDDFALVSTTPDLLATALASDPRSSLSTTAAFGEALRRTAGGSLAFAFSQFDPMQVSGARGSASSLPATRWSAGALRMTPESMRFDITTDVDSTALRPAARGLLSSRPNALRAVTALPPQTALLVAWNDVKALWDAVAEAAWSDAEYSRLHRETLASTGLDLDDDLFSWMTGEAAVYVVSGVPGSTLGPVGIGLMFEAREPAVVNVKLDKIVDALSSLGPPLERDVDSISGEEFTRLRGPALDPLELYIGIVDNWAVITTSAHGASQVVAGLRGDAALSRTSEYLFVRNALRDPLRLLAYVDTPQLVELTLAALGAFGLEQTGADEVVDYLRPIHGVGLALNTAPDRVDAALFAHIVIPE